MTVTSDQPPGERADAELPGRTYSRLGPRVWIFGALMVAIGVVTTYLIYVEGVGREYLKGVGLWRSYFYLSLYAIPANTAISVFPHEPMLVFFGEFANIWVTAAAATVGTLVAAYMDHTVFTPVLNLEGRQAYKEKEFYRKAAYYFQKWPFPTLVVAGATPIPFWPFKFLTFSVHYPLRKYMLAVAVARFPRYVVLAWVGLYFDVPIWLLAALFLVLIAMYVVNAAPRLWKRWKARRRGADDGGPDAAPPSSDGSGRALEPMEAGDGPA